MDAQFRELATEITEAVTKSVTEAVTKAVTVAVEERLTSHFRDVKEHIDKFENRTEERMKMHFENLEGTVKLAGEGYGTTLEGIERKLAISS